MSLKLPAVCCLVLSFAACQNNVFKQGAKTSQDNMYPTVSSDQEMNHAMEVAQKGFSRFDSAYMSGKYDADKFSIKVRFTHSKGAEYIWLVDILKKDGHYWGLVSDTPRVTRLVKLGDVTEIKDDDIVDWLYGKDSILHGGYTMRLIFSRMSDEEKAAERTSFPYKIID